MEEEEEEEKNVNEMHKNTLFMIIALKLWSIYFIHVKIIFWQINSICKLTIITKNVLVHLDLLTKYRRHSSKVTTTRMPSIWKTNEQEMVR